MPAENGYVPTPEPAAEYAVGDLFEVERPGSPSSPRLLLPGLGTGNLYDAVVRYCTPGEGHRNHRKADYPVPDCVGVENDPNNVGAFEMTHPDHDVDVQQADFLLNPPQGPFDWVLANPPYTRYSRLSTEKRTAYGEKFETAEGKFPVFAPFVEQALELLKEDGWATFILPVQALTVSVCEPLQDLLAGRRLGRIALLPEPTFDRQVQTIVVTLKNTATESREEPFWIERPYVWDCAMERYLEGVGVDDVEEADQRYEREFAARKAELRGSTGRAMLEWMKEPTNSDAGDQVADSSTSTETTLDQFV